MKYGRGALTLCSNRGMRNHGRMSEGGTLFRIHPTHLGKRVPFAVQLAGPAELTLHTRYGDVRFTWASDRVLLAEGDRDMGLLWTRHTEGYELMKARKNGAWETCPRNGTPLCFQGLGGSTFAFDDTWEWYSLSCGDLRGHTAPGPDGTFTMVCEEFPYGVQVRESYPSYAEGRADMEKDWQDFLEKYPHFSAPYESGRADTAYVLWSHLVAPTQLTPRWMMLMFPGEMDSAWQLIQNGVALQEQPELSRSLLLAPLERQSEEGQLADSYDETFLNTGGFKPPVYGWAVKNLLRHDLLKDWPREELEKLYEGAGKWADWFMTCRDDDGDGLPGFEGGTECGFDEVSAYLERLSLATPDLCAFEVLNFEAQGDLARLLGKPREEIDAWYEKSRSLLQRMLDKMWDGEKFIALTQYDHKPVHSGALMFFMPLMLGRRLPAEVLDKLTADLMTEGAILSPYGLASERMDSDVFEFSGVKMGCGAVCPPGQLFIVCGLWDGGKKNEAREITRRYLTRLMEGGYSHFIDPVSGDGSPFWGTWARTVFTILARLEKEEA